RCPYTTLFRSAGLLEGEALRVLRRQLLSAPVFVHVRRDDLEGDAELRQELAAAGRGGGEVELCHERLLLAAVVGMAAQQGPGAVELFDENEQRKAVRQGERRQ